MSSGGGKSKTTTVQRNDPWIGVQPYLSGLYRDANAWASDPNAGRVAGINQNMADAIAMTRQRAMAGSPTLRQAHSTAQQFARGDFVNNNRWITHAISDNPWARGAGLNDNAWAAGRMAGQNPWANGLAAYENIHASDTRMKSNPWATGALANENQWANGTAQGQNIWANTDIALDNDTARGTYLRQGNPYVEQMVQAAMRPIVSNFQNAIAPSLASQFSLAGRTGSGSHMAVFDQEAATLGRQLGDTAAQLYGTTYENERGRQVQAMLEGLRMKSGAYEAERGRRAGAYEAERQRRFGAFDTERNRIAQAYEAERQRKFGAYGQERGFQASAYEAERARQSGAYEAAMARALNVYNSEQQRRLAAAGMAPQLAAADYLDAQALMEVGQIEREVQQAQYDAWYNKLANYNQLLMSATPYATQTGTQTQRQPNNRVQGVIGGALAGGAIGGPWGALAGGALGLFG